MPFFTRQGRHLFLRLPSAAASHPIHPCSAVVVRREVPAEKEEGKKGRISRPYLTLLSCGFCPSGPSFIGGTEPGRPSLPPLILRKRSPPFFSLHQFRRENRDLRRKCLTFAPSFLRPLLLSLAVMGPGKESWFSLLLLLFWRRGSRPLSLTRTHSHTRKKGNGGISRMGAAAAGGGGGGGRACLPFMTGLSRGGGEYHIFRTLPPSSPCPVRGKGGEKGTLPPPDRPTARPL